jgi:hypothetical protein
MRMANNTIFSGLNIAKKKRLKNANAKPLLKNNQSNTPRTNEQLKTFTIEATIHGINEQLKRNERQVEGEERREMKDW